MTTKLPSFNCDLTDDHDNSHSMDDRVLSVREILAGKGAAGCAGHRERLGTHAAGFEGGHFVRAPFGWIVFSSGAGGCAEHIAQLCR